MIYSKLRSGVLCMAEGEREILITVFCNLAVFSIQADLSWRWMILEYTSASRCYLLFASELSLNLYVSQKNVDFSNSYCLLIFDSTNA